jgi:tetratricopeptide (TPR) repeat protein
VELMPNSVYDYIQLVRSLFTEGRVEEAVVLLREAVQMHPTEGYLFSQFGYALWETGLREEAITACYASARLDADLECPRLIQSHHLRTVGRFDEALAVLREGLSACPRLRVLWLCEIAHVYEETGEFVRAISHFDQALPRPR